jgi:hypothetical protein
MVGAPVRRRTGRLPPTGRRVGSTSVRADVGGEVNIALRVSRGQARRARSSRDARAGSSVSPLRLSAHSGLPGASWTCEERRPSMIDRGANAACKCQENGLGGGLRAAARHQH